jgi:1,4-alpha-glucan branching enzyme
VSSLGDQDLYLWGEGRHEQIWKVLGSHHKTHEDVLGTSFSVWAPRAQAVRVVGDFNDWNGVGHAMRRVGSNGLWEIFVPGVGPNNAYKFEILTTAGVWALRADPFAQYTEVPPSTASKTVESRFEWSDDSWMTARAATNPHTGPMSVYEMHLGSWRPGHGYREIAEQLIGYVQSLGYTHVEFMPLAEHPFGGSWGYQVTGYFAPTSRFGHPDDLKYLINELHNAGIGVIMDWVPAHFPKDEWALAKFDGEPLFEHPDPRRGEQPDWGTLVFDFGQPQVRNFLVASGLYWLDEFHIDGLRVDAVASMLYLDYSRKEGEWYANEYGGRENLQAIQFLQEATATAYARYPGIVMIAEESTAWPGVTAETSGGGLGFGMKWNMGWMHDSLQYMERDPAWRSHHHGEITFSFLYAFSENFMLPISHDEVVHGKGSLLHKMPGDQWQKLANVRAYLAFMWMHPGKKLLFMGQEFGQPSEWSEERGLDWWILDQPAHQGLARLVGQLNHLYRDTPALWELDNEPAGFEWIEGGDAHNNLVAFLRRDASGGTAVGVFNFGGTPLNDYRLAMPSVGTWREALNSDASDFGGSGVGNFGTVIAESVPWGGRDASAVIQVPPLGGLWLLPE